MTAGANDASGAQSSFHTLESEGIVVTRLYDGASDETQIICHQTAIRLPLTINPRGPLGPCIPAGPESPGAP